jgi:phosphomannomutase/CTP:molybdopterin cytidylyltransferase MocA
MIETMQMPAFEETTERSPAGLKAVILAAGKESHADTDQPLMLQMLGECSVLECVVRNALEAVRAEDIYIVVGSQKAQIQSRLGEKYRYVLQQEPLGTGDAVSQVSKILGDFHGNLLILYGDTPLFRPDTIRGLLNRHRLKKAHLTLLTANVNRPLPYGRIIRDVSGQIVDIIEDRDASEQVREIRELNAGAYVVDAGMLASALEDLGAAPLNGQKQLTDCVHRLIRRGCRITNYQLYDEDEVQGINTVDDLERAKFILQKRLYRPHREEEQNLVVFGTGGWRAIIGEGFTMHNVRRLSQALSNGITRSQGEVRGVLIGYDRRFLSKQAADAAAEVFAGNNIPVTLLSEDAPTPLITFATAIEGSAYGLVFTASHNPPVWNGLKVFHSDGSLLLDEETHRIENETNSLTPNEVIKLELDLAIEAGVVKRKDFTNAYVDAIEAQIDMEAIRKAGLKVIVDPMYGVGQLTLGTVLTEARCRVTFIHERHNPLFGGRSPAPSMEALRILSSQMEEDGYDVGLAMDGDADRIAILDEMGRYISVNDLLLLLYWYLHEARGERGGVVRNLSTTHLLDRLAHAVGEECYEVPVGFKHVVYTMQQHNALLGGESSGGLTIRGHILGKDGIFAAALVVEMLARTGQKISELRKRVYAITGTLYDLEESIPATPEMRIAVPHRLKECAGGNIGPYPVIGISYTDGIKMLLANDNWALLRFSGTEPLLRLTVQADTEEKAGEMLQWLRQFVT